MSVYYERPGLTLHQGHVLEGLAELPAESVDCCVTSPPYLGLRAYSGEQERVWFPADGRRECAEGEHEWGDIQTADTRPYGAGIGMWQKDDVEAGRPHVRISQGRFCRCCGAWRGALGLEPSVELYVAHIVEVCRAIRRVLKPTATLWLNLGDAYAGSGQGWSHSEKQGSNTGAIQYGSDTIYEKPPAYISSRQPNGVKPLDLMGVPEAVVLALRADGWYWRSTVIYNKPAPMPESVQGWRWERCRVKVGNNGRAQARQQGHFQDHNGNTVIPDAIWADCPGCPKCAPNGGLVLRCGSGRPTRSHEVIYVLGKTANYYWDTEAVREPHTQVSLDRQGGMKSNTVVLNGRNLRDVWTLAPEPFDLEMCRACKIVYEKQQYNRLQVSMNKACPNCGGRVELGDRGWEEWHCVDCMTEYDHYQVKKMPKRRICRCGAEDWLSHFATYPTELPAIAICGSTSERGNCPKCGAPWARIVEPSEEYAEHLGKDWADDNKDEAEGRGHFLLPNGNHSTQRCTKRNAPALTADYRTLGWRATCLCAHPTSDIIAIETVIRECFNGDKGMYGLWERNARAASQNGTDKVLLKAVHGRKQKGQALLTSDSIQEGQYPTDISRGALHSEWRLRISEKTGTSTGDSERLCTRIDSSMGGCSQDAPIGGLCATSHKWGQEGQQARESIVPTEEKSQPLLECQTSTSPLASSGSRIECAKGSTETFMIPYAPCAPVVLDPFFGSGRTGLAAQKAGRRCIGIELSEDYVKLAISQLQQGSLL